MWSLFCKNDNTWDCVSGILSNHWNNKKKMPAWSINSQIRTPLLLMASIEALIAFSSLYVAGIIAFGTIDLCEEALGSLLPRATIVAAVVVISLVAMGLYQFHQRLYFREAVARVLAGLAASSVALAVIFYV